MGITVIVLPSRSGFREHNRFNFRINEESCFVSKTLEFRLDRHERTVELGI
jgi:hypothetical protein